MDLVMIDINQMATWCTHTGNIQYRASQGQETHPRKGRTGVRLPGAATIHNHGMGGGTSASCRVGEED